ncbi:hypothetical protein ACFQZ4_19170 [Catellatospora coxensis]|uniref:LPXTG-motif cell wall-anchored protein n=1 Tax=Catellatospora coxensis TaxID=310354 RepID=A0A8J3P9T2_9ACTN|nr:hypothetical protein [Catellatospora coxensis]GIG08673.1 hypothetical protein Cco03nite_53730 [Catellatospora coxensis]
MSTHAHRPRRGATTAFVLLTVAAALLATATPAQAHPFGDPQTVAIAPDAERPEVVHVRWKVGGVDDLTLLGVALGLLPQDRVMLDGAVFYQDSDAAAIGPSAEFAAYLLKQITVTSGGQGCGGVVAPPGDLARTGVTIDYTCPGPVGVVAVGVRTLTDLNPAYRTLATGPEGARAVYASDQPTHDWVLGNAPPQAAPDLGRSAAVQISAVVGGVLLIAVAVVVLWRRAGRRRQRVAQ